MSRQDLPLPAVRALAPSEAGTLALLLGANLAALSVDILMCALYPSLAARFGAPLETVVLLTTPRSLVQVCVVAIGPLADRIGRTRILVAGLLLIAAGAAGAAVAGGMGAMAVTQVAFGLGVAIASAVVPAIVGDRYSYGIRGRALSVVRLSMPLTLIVVVPGLVAVGVRYGVVAPFVLLASAAALLAFLAAWRLPRRPTGTTRRATPGPSGHRRVVGVLRVVPAPPRVLALLGLSFLLALAPTSVFSFLPAWVTATFGDPARNVGLALTADGTGALAGIALGALLVDRLTKRRAGVLSLAAAGCAGFALAAAGRSLGVTLLAVSCFSGALEIAFIALMALLSEAAPEARGMVMGFWAAALALGASVTPLLARVLWRRGTMAAVAGAAGVLLLALALGFALAAVEPRG